MEANRPTGTPPGTIQIDPEDGFGPHLVDDFMDLYGPDSNFVAGTADCLTRRFIRVLIKAGKLAPDTVPVQFGGDQAREALDDLLRVLERRGAEKPSVALMQSAVGHAAPEAFQSLAQMILGVDSVERWFTLFEQGKFEECNALLNEN